MDIHNRYHQFNIKRFTLTAIASAILTLQAEIASAVSCPPFISGTPLAGLVCAFDTGSSVTVENGGSVGGISMSSYQPLSSYLTIQTGGSISNTTGIGIAISNSSLSNGISNRGTISAAGTGIAISSTSTISGGISNSGTIVSTNAGTGIRITSSSVISGNISNSGTITGSGLDEGLSILNQSIVNGSISNNGLINAGAGGNGIVLANSGIVTGGISNNGTIKSVANAGISIINLSRVQGDIVNGGTISGGDQGLSIHNGSTVNGRISNSGKINGGNNGISIYSSTAINGNISNSGTISGGTTGIGILSSSTINGGISNSGTIQGDTFAINIANSLVSNIDILGKSARIIGAVNANNTDVNITNGAIFTSEGTYDVNTFNIAQKAVFNMANLVTVANGLNNSGTLSVTDSVQTITGNYTQNVGGVFKTSVSNVTSYGQLSVSGAVDLSQSGNIYAQVAQNASLHAGDVITDVLSGNTFTTPTNGYQVADNSYIWKFTATPNLTNTGVNLVASIDPVATTACQGDYCHGAANVIIGQVAAGNSAFGAYAAIPSASAFQTVASQATPELTNENMQVTQVATKSVMDVVPMWGTLNGKSAGDAMLSESGKVWLKPYGATIIQDKINSVDGFNATAYGLVVGKDIQLTGNWLFGGAFALGKDNMRGKAQLSGQTINSDVYQALVYGARKLPYNLYLAGQGLIGYGDNNTSRSIPLYASTAQGSYNSWFTNLRAQLGWNVYALDQRLVLTPELDASYLYVNQGSYRESGSSMDLLVASNNNSSFVIGAYGNGAYHLTSFNKTQYLTLTAYAGIARNVLNTQPQTTATFVAGGPSFSTVGVQFNKTVFRGGVGLNIANPTKPLRVNINYDAQTGNNAYSGIGSVTISYVL